MSPTRAAKSGASGSAGNDSMKRVWAGVVVVLWSVAFRWGFPSALPSKFTTAGWQSGAGWAAAWRSVTIGLSATLLALVLAVLWLESESRRARGPMGLELLIYLPLLLPQVAFLYGLNVVALRLGLSGGVGAVVWAHVIFVFPYVMIALSGPWRQLDPALIPASAALGAGPWRRLWAVKLPVLLRPLLVAGAVGLSVSVAQYLPTLFLGAGRVSTLTTEAVTLSSSSDRRVTAVYATLQAALPFLAYGAAFAIPAWMHRNRRGLLAGGGT